MVFNPFVIFFSSFLKPGLFSFSNGDDFNFKHKVLRGEGMIGYLYWDPSRYICNFSLPLLHRPILWYGVLFAAGFFLGFFILRYLLSTHLLSNPYFTKEDLRVPTAIAKIIKESVPGKEYPSIFDHPSASVHSLSKGLNDIIDDLRRSSRIPSLPFLLEHFVLLLSIRQTDRLRNRLCLDKTLSPVVCTLFEKGKLLSESIAFSCMLGAVIGARLGDVLFYQNWKHFIQDPFVLFRIWEGGLASHGGALGVIIALLITAKKNSMKKMGLSLLSLLDLIVIPTALLGCLIRIGNFINQEILGTPSNLPWAVIFGHPADGSFPVPRHPVQIYEAMTYLLLFVVMGSMWKRWFMLLEPGKLFGLFLSLLFTARFLLEFLKIEQSEILPSSSFLTMGQYLSLPFIFTGLFFFSRRALLHKKR